MKIEQGRAPEDAISQETIQFSPSIVVLAGISLTGKTTLGKELADRTNFVFCDVDERDGAFFKRRPIRDIP